MRLRNARSVGLQNDPSGVPQTGGMKRRIKQRIKRRIKLGKYWERSAL